MQINKRPIFIYLFTLKFDCPDKISKHPKKQDIFA